MLSVVQYEIIKTLYNKEVVILKKVVGSRNIVKVSLIDLLTD